MFLQSSFTTEFLSETNLVLTQEDHGNQLTDMLTPIKAYIQSDKDLLPFSLARYCGADSRLAFYAQWQYFSFVISFNSEGLLAETEDYLNKKVPAHLRGLPNLSDRLEYLSRHVFLPQQLEVFQSKTHSLIQDILVKSGFLQSKLSRGFIGKIIGNELKSKTMWLDGTIPIPSFLRMQSLRESYITVCYPVLLGLMYNYNQESSPVNPQAIKWVLLDELLEAIAALHQTGRSFELERYLYFISLQDPERFEWLQKSIADQRRVLMQNYDIQNQGKEYRLELHRKGTQKLQAMTLPEKDSAMLKDLLDWSLSLNFINE